MSPLKIAAILLIIAGALGLAYGGFSYTSDTHRADIGPMHLKVTEKEHISIPIWAGVGAIVAGGLMLGFGGRKTA
jgi:drug/metabolite transporter (DMT)-like permease